MGKMNELSQVVARERALWEGYFQCSEAEQEARTAEYKTVIAPALLAAYGVDGPARLADPWMFETYHELYKDRYNVRPSGDTRYATMKAFMDNIPPLEDFLDDEEDEMEAEGDRFDPDISKWDEADAQDDFDARVRDFEETYGVSAMGQALKLSGDHLRDY